MNNKEKNKGFSLVELIVVIAVMAILVGVLAPAYLRYVDKAKVQKDVSAVAEVIEAVKIAAAEEAVSEEIGTSSTPTTVEITGSTGNYVVKKQVSGTEKFPENDLEQELQATVGTTLNLTSTSVTKGKVTIKVTKDTNHNLEIAVETTDITGDADTALKALKEN